LHELKIRTKQIQQCSANASNGQTAGVSIAALFQGVLVNGFHGGYLVGLWQGEQALPTKLTR
jgi:uncharacterized membrane protein YiaA